MNGIEFELEVDVLGVHNKLSGKKNVVYELRSFLIARCGGIEERRLIVTALNDINFDNFIEYEDLTKSNLIEWVNQNSGGVVEMMKLELIEQIFPTRQYLKPPYIIEE